MKTTLHKAETRGKANLGWLDSRHTFSFADYHNSERMRFGVLRVLNDDFVAPGKGFDTHPHQNMEIISIPLEGALEHRDSMGNHHTIEKNDIQVMSAGTGIRHSEYNKNSDKQVNFLQIWIFPKENGLEPRYDQISLDPEDRKNRLQQILSPNPDDEGIWIYQDAWFFRGDFDPGKTAEYTLKNSDNGVYIFVLDGSVEIAGQELSSRDGLALSEMNAFSIRAISQTELLLMEIPLVQSLSI